MAFWYSFWAGMGGYGVENPGYTKTQRILTSCGAAVRPLPLDGQGLRVDALEEAGVRVVHVTPSHHYPLGIIMPVARRQALLRWAEAAPDRYILEDDYDSEFRFSGRPIPALQSLDGGERVVYLNTFAKSLAPSLRISYMVLPPTCWSGGGGISGSTPPPSPPLSSTPWPASWSGATLNATSTAPAPATKPGGKRCWPPPGTLD